MGDDAGGEEEVPAHPGRSDSVDHRLGPLAEARAAVLLGESRGGRDELAGPFEVAVGAPGEVEVGVVQLTERCPVRGFESSVEVVGGGKPPLGSVVVAEDGGGACERPSEGSVDHDPCGGDDVVGIFSERDYARKVALHGRVSQTTLIREIMTPDVISVRPDQTVEKCMRLMTDKHIRHLPVIDENGRLEGIISIGDVVKMVISEQQMIIDHLQGYITGGG